MCSVDLKASSEMETLRHKEMTEMKQERRNNERSHKLYCRENEYLTLEKEHKSYLNRQLITHERGTASTITNTEKQH